MSRAERRSKGAHDAKVGRSKLPILAQLAYYGVTSLGAYIALNALLMVAGPFVQAWPIGAKTAVTVPPMVIVMIHAVVPFAMRVKARILEGA
ncbi:MAG: hypothetical protein KDG54_16580 [Geminicoccaceae bacterium]|nr:hypothetical protein [Geminicoccaceae bacterium]